MTNKKYEDDFNAKCGTEMNNIITIIKKEFIHIIKDPGSLFFTLVWPVILLIFFGYAITLEIRGVQTIVSDNSHSAESRLLVQKLAAGHFFKVRVKTVDKSKINQIFQQKKAKCVIIIPENLVKDLQTKPQADIQVLIDASDPNSAANIYNYLNMIVSQYNKELNSGLTLPVELTVRFLYNPELKSTYFFVPGLTAVIMLLLSALLTSIAIVREKEQGSMDQILVSPVTAMEIVLGKVIPYVLVAFLAGIIVLFAAMFWFGVPMRGSFVMIMATMLVYVFTGASFGILVSSIAKTQQIALLISLITTLLPTILLSGFMFPIESMPLIFQWISAVIPATHYIQIIRGIMLKGAGIAELYDHILALFAISMVLIVVSIKKMKDSLE
ncbi:MAG: ABC transporter permease [Candidatus Margulisbacteria bacterium]|nr:ABC transporter permease [Candidatus Margulisiibacteriota bacterium]